MPLVGWEEVLDDPHGVAARLLLGGAVYGLTALDVVVADSSYVIFRLTLEPWAAMAELAYPTEQVSILIKRGGDVQAFPLADDRPWYHRFHLDDELFGRRWPRGRLCLWDHRDPRELRWEWDDGLVAHITIVHRHLQAEEFWRRHNHWPSEDSPHGDGPHPILSPALRDVARRAS